MEKYYLYSSLLALFGFLFQSLASSYFLGALFIYVLMLFICSKLYRFQSGKKLTEGVQRLFLLKSLRVVFRDERIAKNQNATSLFVLLFCVSLGLSMIIVFGLNQNIIPSLLVTLGCITISFIFSAAYLKKYIV